MIKDLSVDLLELVIRVHAIKCSGNCLLRVYRKCDICLAWTKISEVKKNFVRHKFDLKLNF